MQFFENETARTANEWHMFIAASTFLILCTAGFWFFEPAIHLEDMVLNMFDAVIICVLIANAFYFLRRNKGIAFVSFLLGLVNLVMLAALIIQ
ncbi:hypothetical protein [Bacillus swezeyi]|uniref:hypothetical protein n=1 Tax=Bacillus swezeyi TaxID=1925020 RepID=UPI003F8B2125